MENATNVALNLILVPNPNHLARRDPTLVLNHLARDPDLVPNHLVRDPDLVPNHLARRDPNLALNHLARNDPDLVLTLDPSLDLVLTPRARRNEVDLVPNLAPDLVHPSGVNINGVTYTNTLRTVSLRMNNS
jgi:hypothetical protein